LSQLAESVPREPKPVLPPWTRSHYVGIDENGMGPRLGPLIVTSILAQVDDAGAKLVTSRPRGSVAKRIGDSKKLVAFDDSALGEAWARAITLRAGVTAATPAELLTAIAIDTDATLQAPCPSHHVDLCWNTEGESFVSDDATVAACAKDLDRLEAKGVRVRRARVAVVCTKRLNQAVDRGLSRFDVDLHTMERLTLDARDEAHDEVYALCGKVGGFDFYGDRFGPLAGYLHTVLLEGRARSEYQVPGVGRLAFVRDADDTHLIVGLASLVGKWARDHLMRRVVRFHRLHGELPGSKKHVELPDASGYHDPVTTQFIRASAIVRKQRRVEPACFERTALGNGANASAPTSSAPKKLPKEPKPRSKRPTPEAQHPPSPPRPSQGLLLEEA
jgi:ribonuclease HII